MTYDSRNPEHKARNQEYQRKWYLANKQKQVERTQEQKIKNLAKTKKAVYEYLQTHPCVDCGDTRVIVLEFDHVRGIKEHNISEMLSSVFALEKVFAEIEKCDVVCRNCHVIRTAQTQGWTKLSF